MVIRLLNNGLMKRVAFTIFFLLMSGLATLSAQVLTLQDGTPVRLRLERTISSATAHEGETVDFEVTEPVIVRGLVVIPKGSLALGHVSKVRQKRRFGRAGELEVSVDTVRLADGSTAPLRATSQEGGTPMDGGRIAATVVASPVLVWVKGKTVQLDRGMDTTAYVRGNIPIDEAKLRAGSPGTTITPPLPAAGGILTNLDVIQMQKAGLSEDVILSKIATSDTDFRTSPQDLIDLKNAGVSDRIIQAIVQKTPQH